MNVVEKYGGTSVADIDKIKQIAEHVAQRKKSGDNIVVVASAMGKTTNKLIELASQIGDNIDKRELDSLLSTGEQQTITLLALALKNIGCPAISLTGFQCGFLTNNNYSHAKIKDIRKENLDKYLEQGYVVVVAGFQGIDEEGNITTLGRGGSDTTAVAIAAKLGWDCEIYTDVDCVYTIDPRLFPSARKLNKISYDEMMEMASFGAGVLETRSVELAKKYGVKLFVGRSLEEDRTRGTYIVDKMDLEFMPITGMSVIDDCVMMSLQGIKNEGTKLAEIFKIISNLDININMISQQIMSDKTVMLSFSCKKEQSEALIAKINNNNMNNLEVKRQMNLVKISLVGIGILSHSSIVTKVVETLEKENIRYYQLTTSEISISVTIDKDNKQKAINDLCSAFGL